MSVSAKRKIKTLSSTELIEAAGMNPKLSQDRTDLAPFGANAKSLEQLNAMLKCISLKIEESRAPTLGIMAKVALRGLKMFPRGKDFLKFSIERDVLLI